MEFFLWLLSPNLLAMRFTHVLSRSVVHSLMLLSSIPQCGCIQFAHSAAEGHRVVFFWNDRNVAAENIHMPGLCGHMFLFPLGKYLWMGLLVQVGSIFLTLRDTTKLFSKVALPFGLPTSNVWEFQLLHILLFMDYFSYSPRTVQEVKYYCFYSHFMNEDTETWRAQVTCVRYIHS